MASTTKAAAVNRHLVAMPYPGRGHINPMLNLCKVIASKSPNLQVTIVVTEEWHGLLTGGAESQPPPPPNLSFGVIQQVVPSESGRGKDFPSFIEATLTKLEAPFERLLDRLEPPPTAVVYDTYLFWAAGVANRRNLPVAAFCTTSATMFTVLCHFDLLVENGHYPLQVSERGSEVVDYIPGLPPTAIRDFPTVFDGDGAKVLHRVLESIPAIQNAEFLLLTSIPELEGDAIDALKSKFSPSTAVLPIGPMIPYFSPRSDFDKDYLQWLDTQPTGSVLYVSMGSFLSTSPAQMDEIIAGITNSGVRYLWVTRGDNLPFKAEEERGCLVRWCDQLRVLSHPAVGGFWSHCGWNSTSEAAFSGVPVLMYPLFWDQLLNGKTAVEEWKMGQRVRRSGGQELVTREEIAEIVIDFMDSAGQGRRKMVESAQRVSQAYRRAVARGGSASSNLDTFLSRIS
ncbi:hypothetical protein V2J09_014059 [Rumex salicifolius]